MYIIKILMPFNVLIDTDMGLWNLIQFDYRNDIFFLKGMLDMSDTHKKYFMITRDNRNPLMTILSEPDETLANDFYSQFMDKEYDQILKLSPNTDVCKILDIMKKSKSNIIRLTILCKDEKEKEIVLSRKLGHDSIVVGDFSSISISDYGTIFIKDIEDLGKFRHIEGKTIYVANYGFNILMDKDNINPVLPLDILEKYAGENEFYVYSVYNLDPRELPKG